MSFKMDKRQRVLRGCFYIGSALLWLAALAISLELYTAGSMIWTERHNPYIVAVKEQKPLPPFPPRPAPQTHSPTPALPEWTFKNHIASPDQNLVMPAANDLEKENQYPQFPTLPNPAKNIWAILNSRYVIMFDHTGQSCASFGDATAKALFESQGVNPADEDIRSMWEKLTALGLETLRTQKTVQGKTSTPDKEETITAIYAPGTDSKESAYVFMSMEVAPPAEDVPADSPWEIPFYKYKGGLKEVQTSGWTLTTNRLGFRNPEIAIPKPSNTYRIVCVGGSTTEEGPSMDKTYPALLQEKLQAAFPGKSVEVINAGVSGMSTRKHIVRLPEYLAMQPDLILLYEGINDATVELPIIWHLLRLGAWQKMAGHSNFLRQHFASMFNPDAGTIQKDLGESTLTNLEAFAAAARAHGVPVAVCSVACPAANGLSPAEYAFFDYHARTKWQDPLLSFRLYAQTITLLNAALPQFCREHALAYLPVAEHIGGSPELFMDICHMTDTGIERKATILFEWLRESLAPTLSAAPQQ